MPYQYKREPLSDDEVNRLTNTCDAFGEKFVIWTLLGTKNWASVIRSVSVETKRKPEIDPISGFLG